MATKTVYCPTCHEETAHAISVHAATGEADLTCECGHFVRIPTGLPKEQIEALLAEHKRVNQPIAAAMRAHQSRVKKAKDYEALIAG
jgi:hypothetical protein